MFGLERKDLVSVLRWVLIADWSMARRLYLVSKLFRELSLKLTNGWPRSEWVSPIYERIEEGVMKALPWIRQKPENFQWWPNRHTTPELQAFQFPKSVLVEACWCEGPVAVEKYPDYHLTLYPTDGVIWMGMLPTSFTIFHVLSIRSLDPKMPLKVVYHDHVRTQEIDLLIGSDREPSRPYLVSAGGEVPAEEEDPRKYRGIPLMEVATSGRDFKGPPQRTRFRIANGMVGWVEGSSVEEPSPEEGVLIVSRPEAEWLPILLRKLFPGWALSDFD